MELIKVVKGIVGYLWKSPEAAPVRRRAILLSLILLIGLPVGMAYLPLPAHVHATGQLARENEHLIRAQQPGFIRQVNDLSDLPIQKSAALVQLENLQLQEALLETQAKLDAENLRLLAYRQSGRNRSLVTEQEQLTGALTEELQYHQSRLARLNVVAPVQGTLVDGLEARDVGRFVETGDPLRAIVSGQWKVKVLLSEREIAAAQPAIGQQVQCRFRTGPHLTLTGAITRIAPAGSHEITSPALTYMGQGHIPFNLKTMEANGPYYELTVRLDPAQTAHLRYGATGLVQFNVPAQPLGLTLIRKLMRFANSLYQG